VIGLPSAPPGPGAPIAVILKGYPRLSETFIAQELRGLERAGLDLRLYSMRYPTDTARHPVHDEIAAPVVYLPEYLYQEPLRVLRSWRWARRLSGYRAARAQFLADLWADPTPNRVRRFGQAMVLARELPDGIGHIHAHFLHTPSSVADYAAMMTGRSWSFSAHAKDIWTIGDWEKRGKLARAAWGVTCTRAGLDHLRTLAPGGSNGRVTLVYHGLDLDDLPAPPARATDNRGRDPGAPFVIASVGRAVPKKGYDIALAALALLPDGLCFEFHHVGGGKGLKALKARARRLGLAPRVRWHGTMDRAGVVELLRRADLFVLPSRIAADGDRDGLPNVLMEAQSQALACIATRLPAIEELIEDGRTGLLVAPDRPDELAAAIERAIADPALRRALAAAALVRLGREFSFQACLAPLLARFGAGSLASPALAAE
jgi:glycosyltransferase involved in cell wall biosynthesis